MVAGFFFRVRFISGRGLVGELVGGLGGKLVGGLGGKLVGGLGGELVGLLARLTVSPLARAALGISQPPSRRWLLGIWGLLHLC